MSTTTASSNTTKKEILETTPRVYYEHYMMETPNYDLYPSLSRRLGNGYIHRPIRPTRPKKQQQTNFISITNTSKRIYYNINNDPLWQPHIQQQEEQVQQQEQENLPAWDLYPAILRNVENFGTDQMRQRLHIMESTIS